MVSKPRCNHLSSKDAIAWFLGSDTNVFIEQLPYLLRQLESDRLPRLLLSYRDSVQGMSVRCNIFYLYPNDVTCAEFAVDSEIEPG